MWQPQPYSPTAARSTAIVFRMKEVAAQFERIDARGDASG